MHNVESVQGADYLQQGSHDLSGFLLTEGDLLSEVIKEFPFLHQIKHQEEESVGLICVLQLDDVGMS